MSCDLNLDLNKMKAAVALLPKYEDYYAFCKSPASFEHTICRVKSAHLWVDKTGERLRFQITANRFLTGMIRIIVGRLLEVGAGKMSLEQFEYHLRERQTPAIITPAFPQGLSICPKLCILIWICRSARSLRLFFRWRRRGIGGRLGEMEAFKHSFFIILN